MRRSRKSAVSNGKETAVSEQHLEPQKQQKPRTPFFRARLTITVSTEPVPNPDALDVKEVES